MKLILSIPMFLGLALMAGLSIPAKADAATNMYQSVSTNVNGFVYWNDASGSSVYADLSGTSTRFHKLGAPPEHSNTGYAYYSSYDAATGETWYGFGDVPVVDIQGNLASASATCAFTIFNDTYDPSTGTWTTRTRDIVMTVDFRGCGDLTRVRKTDQSKGRSLPIERSSFTGKYRTAVVTFSIDDQELTMPSDGVGDSHGEIKEESVTSIVITKP